MKAATQPEMFDKPKKKHRWLKILIIVMIVLGLLLVALEYLLVPVLNRVLDKAVPQRLVQVEEVELQPWFGQFAVEGLTVQVRKSKAKPELAVKRIDITIDWQALLDGAVVTTIKIREPVARYTAVPEKKQVSGPPPTIAKQLGDLLPIRMNRLEVIDGRVDFKTKVKLPSGTNRDLDLKVTNIDVLATNLTNSAKISKSLTGTLKASASAEKWGDINVDGKLNAMAKDPTFDIDASLKNLQLTELSDWTMAFGRFSFSSGSLDVFTEIAAKNGGFVGYIKPLATNVKTKAMQQDLGAQIVAGVVEGVTGILSNPNTKKAGSKVEFRGKLDSPDIDIVGAIIEVLKNAVVRALRPVVDGEINIADAGGEGDKK